MKLSTQTALLLIIFAGILSYTTSLFNGFVWDDEEQILNNVAIHSLSNIPHLFAGSTFNTGGAQETAGIYYKPIMTIVFTLLYWINGPHAFIFHLIQVILHLTNALLVFFLLRKFTHQNAALFTSLIFVINPINIEAVAYISAMQDVLFVFFGLLAILTTFKEKQTIFSRSAAALLLLLSLLSKETGVAFLVLIPLISRRARLNACITAFLAASVYIALRFGLAHIFFTTNKLAPISLAPLSERLLTMPKIIANYFATFIFPNHLVIDQQWVVKSPSIQEFWVPFSVASIVIACLTALGIFLSKAKHNQTYWLFFVWFILGLTLHLQLFPLDMTYADRWFYLPEIGLLGMLAVTVSNMHFKPKAFLYIYALVTLAFIIKTNLRIITWHDGLTLFTHDQAINQTSFDLENNLGTELARANQFDQALIHFQRSVQLAPYWWTNWNNLGVIAQRTNRIDEAESDYQKAIENGDYYLAYENQARLLYLYHEPQKAEAFTTNTLQKFPNNAKLWLILAMTENKLGNKEQALLAAQKSYELSPKPDTRSILLDLQNGVHLK